jgi:hypothetical protein
MLELGATRKTPLKKKKNKINKLFFLFFLFYYCWFFLMFSEAIAIPLALIIWQGPQKT